MISSYITSTGTRLAVSCVTGMLVLALSAPTLAQEEEVIEEIFVTGTLIEGHGGVLNRIDAVCFAAPVFYHVTQYFFGTH